MKKLLALVLAFASLLLVLSAPATADAAAFKKSQRIGVGISRTVRDVKVTFSNIGFARKISYELTYKRGGLSDGAGGIVIPAKKQKSVTKILTLGTCSGKVCTYHKNISGIKLKVTTWYAPSLSVETKTYNVK